MSEKSEFIVEMIRQKFAQSGVFEASGKDEGSLLGVIDWLIAEWKGEKMAAQLSFPRRYRIDFETNELIPIIEPEEGKSPNAAGRNVTREDT